MSFDQDILINEMPLRTAIICKAHDQPLSSHPRRTKLRHLLQQRYYQLNQKKDINRYRANCYTCCCLHIPKDKKLGFLHPLPIPDRPQQHIIVDFKKCLKSKASYNIVAIFVDRLKKRLIIILIQDTVIARELAPLFLLHVVQHISILEIVISDRGP